MFAALMAAVVLHERLSLVKLLGILLAFAGLGLLTGLGSGSFHEVGRHELIALIGALLAAGVLVRDLSRATPGFLRVSVGTDDEHARRSDAVGGIDDRDVVQPPAKIAEREHAADGAADRLIDRTRGAAGRLHAFEQIDDERVGCDGLDRLMSESDAHADIVFAAVSGSLRRAKSWRRGAVEHRIRLRC